MLYSEWLDQDLVGRIQIILPQSLAWLLGFGGNLGQLFFVQYSLHHIETRQIHISKKGKSPCRGLVEMFCYLTDNLCSWNLFTTLWKSHFHSACWRAFIEGPQTKDRQLWRCRFLFQEIVAFAMHFQKFTEYPRSDERLCQFSSFKGQIVSIGNFCAFMSFLFHWSMLRL